MSPVCQEVPGCPSRHIAKDDHYTSASGTLRRLVTFLASALDVRYAFVSAPCAVDGVSDGVALWLARDFGLRSEVAEVDLVQVATPPTPDFVSVLRRAWPDEVDLAGLGRGHAVSLPLVGAGGTVRGHLGIVDPQGRRVLSGSEQLRPLARAATAELERWAAARR